MSINLKNGIGFGSKSRTAFFDMSADPGTATSTAKRPIRETKVKDTDKNRPWAKWGDDNKRPIEMMEDLAATGILNSIIDGKARFAICNGILPAIVHYEKDGQMVIDEIPMVPEIDDFLEDNNHFFHTFGWMKDMCGFGTGIGRVMLNVGRDKIVAFQRDDVSEMRYEKQAKSGRIENIYLAGDWTKIKGPSDENLVKVPLLHWNNPLEDLKERVAKSKEVEFAMSFRYPGWGKKYYPDPLWFAARKWVKIAQGVPEMKAAMFENNFRPKYMVIISKDFWQNAFIANPGDPSDVKNWDDYTDKEQAEKKNKIFDDIDQHLAGNENAYKTIFVDGIYSDGKLLPEIEIRPIEDTSKSGELLPDSAAANSEIAFAALFNPAIIGASMPSGPYTNSQGGSNVREATLLQVIIHELERQNVRRFFNVIKRFNGWDKAYVKNDKQKLEFIIPATIPTTLDTGSNVKPMVTGANPSPNNQKTDEKTSAQD